MFTSKNIAQVNVWLNAKALCITWFHIKYSNFCFLSDSMRKLNFNFTWSQLGICIYIYTPHTFLWFKSKNEISITKILIQQKWAIKRTDLQAWKQPKIRDSYNDECEKLDSCSYLLYVYRVCSEWSNYLS